MATPACDLPLIAEKTAQDAIILHQKAIHYNIWKLVNYKPEHFHFEKYRQLSTNFFLIFVKNSSTLQMVKYHVYNLQQYIPWLVQFYCQLQIVHCNTKTKKHAH